VLGAMLNLVLVLSRMCVCQQVVVTKKGERKDFIPAASRCRPVDVVKRLPGSLDPSPMGGQLARSWW
jgi:hypothetical protein